MNIEIKFRGKRVDNGNWVHGSLILPNTENENTYIQDGNGTCRKVHPETVGQLVYSNSDIKLYVGDIDNKGMVLSYFQELGSYGFKHCNHSAITFVGQFLKSNRVIIGNIHENNK